MELRLGCCVSSDSVRFGTASVEGNLIVDVTRDVESDNIILSKQDVERLYEYLGKHLGKKEESSVKANMKNVEEVSELLTMKFKCTSDPMDTFETIFDENDEELYIHVKNVDDVAAIYLSSEDALTLANNIIKAFGGSQ